MVRLPIQRSEICRIEIVLPQANQVSPAVRGRAKNGTDRIHFLRSSAQIGGSQRGAVVANGDYPCKTPRKNLLKSIGKTLAKGKAMLLAFGNNKNGQARRCCYPLCVADQNSRDSLLSLTISIDNQRFNNSISGSRAAEQENGSVKTGRMQDVSGC